MTDTAATIATARAEVEHALEETKQALDEAQKIVAAGGANVGQVLGAWVNETLRDSDVARYVDAWNFVTGPALKDLERRLSAAE
jgi:hypothetical protein